MHEHTESLSSLSVPHTESPGSSVFDLPIQSANPLFTSSHDASNITFPLASVERDSDTPGREPSFLVISGGTGGNAICSAFRNVCYVLPVSDDGGSSSEIIRVIGGPSVGDIRSRLVRLIPPAPSSSPLDSIRRLLAHRLPSWPSSERDAREHWRDIVEGKSKLWKGIPSDRKETIRGFLVYFERKISQFSTPFFEDLLAWKYSIGNYFLAAAQGFFRSLPSAIFLFSSITNSQANILPVIVTNHTVTIAARLDNGECLVGQCEISHPMIPSETSFQDVEPEEDLPTSPTDGIGEYVSPRQNVMFEPLAKGTHQPLLSRINRIYYINGYGMEIHPSPNPDFLANIASRDVLVYSCGSLWTSIMPCLALKGVALGIARSSSLRAKVLLLNGENDRETEGYSAADYIEAIVRTLNNNQFTQAYGLGGSNTTYPISAFITDLIYSKETKVTVDVKRITSMGVRCRELEGGPRFDADTVAQAMEEVWTNVS